MKIRVKKVDEKTILVNFEKFIPALDIEKLCQVLGISDGVKIILTPSLKKIDKEIEITEYRLKKSRYSQIADQLKKAGLI